MIYRQRTQIVSYIERKYLRYLHIKKDGKYCVTYALKSN